MCARITTSCEDGFTLIEVVLASALFVFVAYAGFEAVRAAGAQVTLLARREHAFAQLSAASSALRSDALSSAAIWKPASGCGDAVAFMQKEAGNATSFLLYVVRPAANSSRLTLFRAASATGAMNPCDPALSLRALVDDVSGLRVEALTAPALAAHTDTVSGNPDGGIFLGAGIAAVGVDAHARDYDGTPILAGNAVTETSIDADPSPVTLDLVAGNRPSGFTAVLTYDCGPRCRATSLFPETRGNPLTACAITYDLPDTPAFYAPAAGQPAFVPAAAGRLRPVISAYAVNVGAVFSFTGPDGASAREELFVYDPSWSAPGMQDVPAIAADGSAIADYSSNSVRNAGAAKIFADANGAGVLAAQLALCAGMHAEASAAGG